VTFKLNVANSIHSDPVLLMEEMRFQTDVVEEHHRRNRLPRAPDPQQLCHICQGHSSTPTSQATPLDENLNLPSARPHDMEGPDPNVAEQLSVSPGELSGPAMKLRSYPPKFHEIIERAKQLAQCGAASNPYPPRAWFVEEQSAVYFTEAIVEREEKGVVIPPGESGLPRWTGLLLIIDRILATPLQRTRCSRRFICVYSSGSHS